MDDPEAETFLGSKRLSKRLTAVFNSSAVGQIKKAAVSTAWDLLVPSDKIEELKNKDIDVKMLKQGLNIQGLDKEMEA